jgi:hypothetical protein
VTATFQRQFSVHAPDGSVVRTILPDATCPPIEMTEATRARLSCFLAPIIPGPGELAIIAGWAAMTDKWTS